MDRGQRDGGPGRAVTLRREGIQRDGSHRRRPCRRLAVLTSAAVLGRVTMAGREHSVPRARAFLDGLLGLSHPCRDVARLLVSELVTNAVQHTQSRRPGGTVTLVVLDLADGIRVEVTDEGSAHSVPVVRDDIGATSGRGLFLVQSLADDWGYLSGGDGTTVWFRLAA